MAVKRRRWERDVDDDPLGGLVNLFDLWIVVVVALTLTLAGRLAANLAPASTDVTETAESENADSVEVPEQRKVAMPRFRPSDSPLSGQGERLGTAYRLSTGEVVYVPENSAPTSSK